MGKGGSQTANSEKQGSKEERKKAGDISEERMAIGKQCMS